MLQEISSLYTGVPHPLIDQVEQRYGAYLQSLLRYDRFRLSETPEEWVRLLGPDVLSATHPHVTAELTRQLIAVQKEQDMEVNENDEILLLATALVHDWGEIVIEDLGVGDRSYDQKTTDDEAVEVSVFEKICAELPPGPDLNLIRNAYQTVQKKDGLGEMFNAVERIGYLLTALRAYQGVGGQRIENWPGLVGNVLSNQIARLREYAPKYPFVGQVLTRNAEDISAAFNEIFSLDQIPLDKQGNNSYDPQKLFAMHEAWKQFLQDN